MVDVNIVFCIVTYKNHNDLKEFAISLKNNSDADFTYRVVVVNNYADDSSLELIRNVTLLNGFDFIENKNLGYSHGNNLAIEFACQTYKYEYLIVCNADIELKNLKLSRLRELPQGIIAPEIECLGNKRQNPLSFQYLPVSEHIIYWGFKARIKIILYFGILLNKLNRIYIEFFLRIRKEDSVQIYACHGSFIIFPRDVIEMLRPVFDERYFLFYEESDLARKAKEHGIKIIFDKRTHVFHKEDGSMKLSDKNLFEIHRQSAIYYFNKWYS